VDNKHYLLILRKILFRILYIYSKNFRMFNNVEQSQFHRNLWLSLDNNRHCKPHKFYWSYKKSNFQLLKYTPFFRYLEYTVNDNLCISLDLFLKNDNF